MAGDYGQEPDTEEEVESNVIDSIDDLVIPKKKTEAVKTELLLHLSNHLVQAKDARANRIDNEMEAYGNIRRAKYDDNVLKEIEANESGSTYYDPVGRTKCRAGIALIEDIFSPSDDKPWTIDHTPVPDLPDDKKKTLTSNILKKFAPMLKDENVMTTEEKELVYEQIFEETAKAHDLALEMDKADANEKAKKMEAVIADQLAEGHYKEATADFIGYLVTYHSAFIKGPLPRSEKAIEHTLDPKTKKYTQKVVDKVKLIFESPSPLDIYPSPDQVGIDDGYFFERMYLDRKYLSNLKNVEGYKTEAIDIILEEYGKKGLTIQMDTDQERREIENKDFKDSVNTEKIEVFEYWGSVQGKMLIEWGITAYGDEELEELGEYEITAWVTADMKHIIRCVLNPDPLGRRPYQMTSYMKVPNAFWGECVPSLMQESQRFINSISRAIENNVWIASGPQVVINDIGRMAEGEAIENLRPWQIWQGQEPHAMAMGQKPSGSLINFEQPQIHAQEITNIKNECRSRVDEETGIPSYSHGDGNSSGAGSTARGLSMLMGAASKIIKQVIRNIDSVNENIIQRLYEYNMLHHEDDSIKGDVTVVPQGALSLIVKEQTLIRLNEFMQLTNNPVDNQIIDMVHRGRMLREIIKDLDLPANAIIPSEEELQKIQSGALQQEVVQQLSEENPLIGMLLSGEVDGEAIMAMLEGQKKGQQMTSQDGAGQKGGGSGSGQQKKLNSSPHAGSGMQESDSEPQQDMGRPN